MKDTFVSANRRVRWNFPALGGLAAALLFCLAPLSKWIVQGHSIPAMLGREAIWWVLAALVLGWLRFVERLPLSSIGFRQPTWKSAAFGLLAAFTVAVIMALHFAVVVPLLHVSPSAALAQRQAILNTPYWYRVLLVLRAAVVEEILFRGYLIEKVQQLCGSTVLSVLVSVCAFSFAHLTGWGAVQLIPVAASGTVFALLYVWRRDLPSNIFGHFVADGLGFLTR